MSDEDLASNQPIAALEFSGGFTLTIFAFLQTVAPVKHRVDNALPATACPVCGGTHGGGNTNVAPQRRAR